MTIDELQRIAAAIDVVLPATYVDVISRRDAELRRDSKSTYEGVFWGVFVDPQRMIDENLEQRQTCGTTEHFFPEWWKTFVLIGTDGGGCYYCARLDGGPGIWYIGTDCDPEPKQTHASVDELIDEAVANHCAREEAEAARRVWMGDEPEVTRQRIAASSSPAKESALKWFDLSGPSVLYRWLAELGRVLTPAKQRWFSRACCRGIPSFLADDDCQAAWVMATKMALGESSPEGVEALRAKLEAAFRGRKNRETGHLHAAFDLLQSDADHLAVAWNDMTGSDLAGVWGWVGRDPANTLDGERLGDLLRDVLGNPFLPAEIQPAWRTPQVVTLAQSIDETEDFSRLGELANALAAAGCDDPRVMAHCHRTNSHTRGCWLIDGLLGRELFLSEDLRPKWTWSWSRYSKIPSDVLTTRLRQLGAERDPGADHLVSCLAFADWLEANGDPAWADYVRLRSSLDRPPAGVDYVDQIERCVELESRHDFGSPELPGLHCVGFRNVVWWDPDEDPSDGGIPALASVQDPRVPHTLFIPRLEGLVAETQIRGIDLDDHYPDEAGAILDSPAGRQLNWLQFKGQDEPSEPEPTIAALAASPTARSLERLTVRFSQIGEADMVGLAAAPMERMRRFTVWETNGLQGSPEAVGKLASCEWFQRLEHLDVGVVQEAADAFGLGLATMERLHTLALRSVGALMFESILANGPPPGLRRLALVGLPLRPPRYSERALKALPELRFPGLVDLAIEIRDDPTGSFRAVFESELLRPVRILSICGPVVDRDALEAMAAHPCAANLRILRLACWDDNGVGRLTSFAGTALARPGAFPSLTTLEISYPFAKEATPDTARLLEGLVGSRLRRLKLVECPLDQECREILSANPNLGAALVASG